MIRKLDRNVILKSSFVLVIKEGRYHIVKNRLNSKEGLVSKKTVRKILKRLSGIGCGSSTWLIVKM
ncbi:MAG: hypothetical protein ACRDBY_12925 [Cetobacterium sp.]